MKRIILLLILSCVMLAFASLLFAQIEEEPLQEKALKMEKQLDAQRNQRANLLHKSDSLATLVQLLKSKKSLNTFQRQRLEQLLKSSQLNNQQLVTLDVEIADSEKQYQGMLTKIVEWYDQKIDSVLDEADEKNITSEKQHVAYNLIRSLKVERDIYEKKQTPQSLKMPPVSKVAIGEFDSFKRIRQKADLLKDQEDKVREKERQVIQQINDLVNELKLRDRMNELISDTYLMDYNSEIPSQPATDKVWNENPTDYTEINGGRFSSTALSPIDAADIFILQTDVSEISTLDLEQYIQRLKIVNKQLSKSADSLQIKADQFYKAAEKRKMETGK
ncbi:MAG: hypothetical protein K8R68_02570 [Bacteroidales bacterium]|nr:hypothetical protein [Bacteroidales bacterium]